MQKICVIAFFYFTRFLFTSNGEL